MKPDRVEKPFQPKARHDQLRTKVVPDKTKYNRKKKHKGNE